MIIIIVVMSFLMKTMQIYIPLEGSRSNVVQTAWALMGLIYAGQVCFLCVRVCVIIGSLHRDLNFKMFSFCCCNYNQIL